MGFALWIISSNVVYAEDLLITGNGSESTNTIAVTSTTQNTSVQENNANVQNTVVQTSQTGDNTVSGTTGGTSTVRTGDTTTNTTIENNVNTSQATTGCCSASGSTSAAVSENGTGSQNQISTASSAQATVTVTQNATIKNTIKGTATTGNNIAYGNSGDVTITTGDIHSNITVVNDPINLSYIQTSHSIEPLVTTIFDNGSFSTDKIIASTNDSVTVKQYNNASIDNFIFLDYLTGGNQVSDTDGIVKILTGDIFSNVTVKNKANADMALVSCNKQAEVVKETPTPTSGQSSAPSANQSSSSGSSVGGASTSSGQILPEAASTERSVGGPSIYGLSNTSSGNVIGGVLLGAVFVAFGAFLFFKGIGSTTK